jgi:hypothetical protein
MNHIQTFMYTPTEIQLANEIADKLQDPASLSQFLRYTKQFPHEFLRECLNRACSTPDNEVRKSRAAIFVNSVKNYKLYSNGYPRY